MVANTLYEYINLMKGIQLINRKSAKNETHETVSQNFLISLCLVGRYEKIHQSIKCA